jgi:hypothetical protein
MTQTALTTTDVNLRTGPGTSYPKIKLMGNKTTVVIAGPPTGGWYPVTAGDDFGYASAAYLNTFITLPATATTVHARFLNHALGFLGHLYHIGGNGPVYLDCSGFTLVVLRLMNFPGSEEDRTADSQMHQFRSGAWQGTKITDQNDLQPGDMIFFGWNTVVDGKPDQHASHVVFALCPAWVLGANGGQEATDTDQEAIDREAEVSIDPINYRWGRIGKDMLDIWRPAYS